MNAMTIGIIALLVVAWLAIVVYRNRGPYTPPSDRQIHAVNAGDTNMLLYTSSDPDDHHYQGDGHDHGAGADFSDSSDAGDGGGSDGGGD